MEYSSEALAEIIIKLDPTALWVHNRYCRSCGTFLYLDNIACKKCRKPATDPVLRVIPFLTSATALEKLVSWVRSQCRASRPVSKLESLIDKIAEIYRLWLESDRGSDTYKLEIVIACINTLK